MKEVGKFYGNLVYFTAISYMLWPFGIFCGHFGVFFSFGMLRQEKSGNPSNGQKLIRVTQLLKKLSTPFVNIDKFPVQNGEISPNLVILLSMYVASFFNAKKWRKIGILNSKYF
jgi:hypothetical protein